MCTPVPKQTHIVVPWGHQELCWDIVGAIQAAAVWSADTVPLRLPPRIGKWSYEAAVSTNSHMSSSVIMEGVRVRAEQ